MQKTIDSSPVDPVSTKLSHLLDMYKELADSNPLKLRNLISAIDIWRLFVEKTVQETGRGIKTIFKKDKYDDFPIATFIKQVEKLDLSCSDSIEKSVIYKILKENDWELDIASLKKISFNQLYKMDRGWIPFEINEKNYFDNLYSAFDSIFLRSHTLSHSWIKKIHYLTTTTVEGTNYDTMPNQTKGEYRSAYSWFNLSKRNCSNLGMYELVNKMITNYCYYISFGIDGIMLETNYAEILRFRSSVSKTAPEESILQHFKIAYDQSNYQKALEERKNLLNFLKSLLSVNEDEFPNLFYSLLDKYFVTFQAIFPAEHIRKYVESNMGKLIQTYNEAIKKAREPKERLLAVVTFIRDCEQLHPFMDANCRTFCMILLNDLLIKNGFPLVILDEPNSFDGFSIEELMEAIIKGIENVFELINTNELFGINSTDIYTSLYGINYKNSVLLGYFSDITQKEIKRRKKFDDSYLINKIEKKLNQLYPEKEALEDDQMLQYRQSVLKTLSLFRQKTLTPEERQSAQELLSTYNKFR